MININSLQKTPLDSVAALLVHGLIDNFMSRVMKKLNLEIPKFYLTRYFKLELLLGKAGENSIVVRGIDENGAPYSCFTQVTLMAGKTRVIIKREPFIMPMPKGVKVFDLIMYSYGHYKEPGCKIPVNLEGFKPLSYQISYDPAKPIKGWQVNFK